MNPENVYAKLLELLKKEKGSFYLCPFVLANPTNPYITSCRNCLFRKNIKDCPTLRQPRDAIFFITRLLKMFPNLILLEEKDVHHE